MNRFEPENFKGIWFSHNVTSIYLEIDHTIFKLRDLKAELNKEISDGIDFEHKVAILEKIKNIDNTIKHLILSQQILDAPLNNLNFNDVFIDWEKK